METRPVQRLREKHGWFNDIHIDGREYQLSDGTLGWKVSMASSHGLAQTYWVVGEDFFRMAVHHMMNQGMETQIEILGPANLSGAHRKEILAAILQWQNEAPPK